jgi:hypothetical protein
MRLRYTYLIFGLLIALVMGSCAGPPQFGWSAVPKTQTPTDPRLDSLYKSATLSVDFFPTYASLASPTLSQSFTESLRDIFQSQSQYQVINKNGTIRITGSITGYNVKPVSIQSSEVAASNRLTIIVSVKYSNSIEEEKDFEQNFTRFADFDANQSLSAVEDALIEEINEQLVQDIYNRTLGDW